MAEEYISVNQRRDLWQEATLEQWKGLLEAKLPQGDWARYDDETILGKSPIKDGEDSTPSFYIHLDWKCAKCFSTDTLIRDPIEFLREYVLRKDGGDKPSAGKVIAQIFEDRFGVEHLPTDYKESVKKSRQLQAIKKSMVSVFNQYLRESAQSNKDIYKVCDDAQAYLEARCEFDIVNQTNIGALPPKSYVQENISIPDVTGSVNELVNYYIGDVTPETVDGTSGCVGWLTMPYYISPQNVGRIKLLKPDLDDKKQIYLGPDDAERFSDEGKLGYFGLDMFEGCTPDVPDKKGNAPDSPNKVHVVEGEFDQISLAYEQLTKSFPDFVVVAGGGSGVEPVHLLGHAGFEDVRVIPDNDIDVNSSGDGRSFIMSAFRDAKRESIEYAGVFEWPDDIDAEDPDDLVQDIGHDESNQLLERDDLYETPERWAENRISEEIRNVSEDNIRAKKDVFQKYQDIVADDGFIEGKFIERVSGVLDMPESTLRQNLASIESPVGFETSIEHELKKIMTPIFRDGRQITVYSKIHKQTDTVTLSNNQKIALDVSSLLPDEPHSWIKQKFGKEPSFILEEGRDKKYTRELTDRAEKCNNYVGLAFKKIATGVPKEENFEFKRQGVHWVDAKRDAYDRERLPDHVPDQRFYVVNGTDVYRGTYDEEKQRMQFVELDKPVEGKYAFKLSKSDRWSDAIDSVETLNSPPSWDPKELYEKVREIIDTGWYFREQRMQCTFLAANLMTIVIAMMFENIMMVLFNAPSQSGKSKFIRGLVAGVENADELNIIEHSVRNDVYSSQGVVQNLQDSPLTACMDEFEDDRHKAKSDKQAKAVNEILQKTRNMNGPEGVIEKKGTSGGDGRTLRYRFPMYAAAIHPFDKEQDRNRWNKIKLEKKKGIKGPQQSVPQQCGGPEMIKKVREAMTLMPLKYAGQIKKSYEEVKSKIYEDEVITFRNDRFVDRFAPTLAILNWIGHNWIPFAQSYVNMWDERHRQATVSEHERMLKKIVSFSACSPPDENAKYSVTQMLNDSKLKERLSDTNVGVYYTPKTPYVVFSPSVVSEKILANTSAYRSAPSESRVRELLLETDVIEGTLDELDNQKHILKIAQHVRTIMRQISNQDLLYAHIDNFIADNSPKNETTEGMEEISHDEEETSDDTM